MVSDMQREGRIIMNCAASMIADGHFLFHISESDAEPSIWPSCQEQAGSVPASLKEQEAQRWLQGSHLHHR